MKNAKILTFYGWNEYFKMCKGIWKWEITGFINADNIVHSKIIA